jgi:hypothetical protein
MPKKSLPRIVAVAADKKPLTFRVYEPLRRSPAIFARALGVSRRMAPDYEQGGKPIARVSARARRGGSTKRSHRAWPAPRRSQAPRANRDAKKYSVRDCGDNRPPAPERPRLAPRTVTQGFCGPVETRILAVAPESRSAFASHP